MGLDGPGAIGPDGLRAALAAGLPGELAWRDMIPESRRSLPAGPPPGSSPREAAVLILLYPADGRHHFPLTLRTTTTGTHKGQVSLPGGSLESGESPETAAIRECHEEVGVDPSSVTLLGRLSRLYIPPSRFLVTPLVGWTSARPDFHIAEEEVELLIEAELERLLDPSTRRKGRKVLEGHDWEIPHFRLSGHEVWGATAMILAELSALVRPLFV